MSLFFLYNVVSENYSVQNSPVGEGCILPAQDLYGDLVYRFRKIIGKNDFPYHFKKIIFRYKKIGYNIDVLRQTACFVVNPVKVNSFAYLFNCTVVGWTSQTRI